MKAAQKRTLIIETLRLTQLFPPIGKITQADCDVVHTWFIGRIEFWLTQELCEKLEAIDDPVARSEQYELNVDRILATVNAEMAEHFDGSKVDVAGIPHIDMRKLRLWLKHLKGPKGPQ